MLKLQEAPRPAAPKPGLPHPEDIAFLAELMPAYGMTPETLRAQSHVAGSWAAAVADAMEAAQRSPLADLGQSAVCQSCGLPYLIVQGHACQPRLLRSAP